VDVNVAVTDYPTVSLTAVDWGEMRQRLDVLERVSRLVAVSGQDIYEGFGVQPPRGDADRAGGPPEPGAPAPPGATQSGPGVAE
jgi:hypothetical protein